MAKPSPTHSGNSQLIAIGRSIRQLRKERNLSQESLALLADLDRSYMGGIERGEHNMTVLNLVKICDALEIQMSFLLELAGS
jgi:transcriptional regulator with XRE-family HTH domain